MANTLDFMDIKQIITLHLNGFSNRKIGTTLKVYLGRKARQLRLVRKIGTTLKVYPVIRLILICTFLRAANTV
jgi:hypothetical protein